VSSHAVCLCDDDNDVEMAMACRHAYVPEVSSSSMRETIDKYPMHFTQTGGEGFDLVGCDSSEAALTIILERLQSKSEETEDTERVAAMTSLD
jgi:hypothetical protein